MENYRAMMSRKKPSEPEETIDSSYASATESASGT